MRPSVLEHDNVQSEVIGVGAATLDDLWLVEAFSHGEGVQKAINHLKMGGGPVATSLCALAKLGHQVALIDSYGDDATGTQILDGLADAGVRTNLMTCMPKAASAKALVMVRESDGARQITFMPSTADEPSLSVLHEDAIRGARLLHLNGRHESCARQCVNIAQSSGTLISFDGGAGRYRESIRDLVNATHLKFVSKDFAQAFTGHTHIAEMMDTLMCGTAKLVVITDGLRGSYIQGKGEETFHQAAYPPMKTVDTTGCGDVFHGAFLHGHLKYWNLRQSADFASRVASRNATGLGGRHFIMNGLASLTP